MATPKPQIRSVFPTPVCVHYLPVAQEVNAELRASVLSKMEADGSTALRGQGWRSQTDFEDWGGGHAQTLFRVVRELADGLTATRSGGRVTLQWAVTATASVRQKGDYQEMAAQPGALWSAVYFADDGYQKSDDEALGGECEFADPRGALPAMVSPQYAFRIPGGVTAGKSEIIRPATGMFLLYPAWLPRGERLFDGAGPRVTIEFDLMTPAD